MPQQHQQEEHSRAPRRLQEAFHHSHSHSHGRSHSHGGEALLASGSDRGCRLGKVAGCHVHGLFASADLRRRLLGHGSEPDLGAHPLDRWADHLQQHGLRWFGRNPAANRFELLHSEKTASRAPRVGATSRRGIR